jgi:hypothetical protein
VARIEFVRLLFALAAHEGWRVHHMEVKSAFLNGDLKEVVYVHQPTGFAIPGKEGKVLRLRKALYGLRQASRVWNAKLDSTLKGMGFDQSLHEAVIYRRGNGGNAMLVGVYVDDLVITGTKDAEVAAFKKEMKATFQMSDLGLPPSTWGSRCTRATPGSRFDRPPTPSALLSWLGSPTATQLSLRWRRD